MLQLMSEAVRNRMTVEEFLAWAEEQGEGTRYELINGTPLAMAPERAIHVKIKFAVASALAAAIRAAGLNCSMFTDGMTVPIDEQTAYEPDALVHCGEPIPDDSVVVSNPIIVVEVLSPGTRHVDTGAKLAGYFTLPSVAHYLIIDPERRLVVHHRREPEGAIGTQIIPSGSLHLSPPGIEFPVADLFQSM